MKQLKVHRSRLHLATRKEPPRRAASAKKRPSVRPAPAAVSGRPPASKGRLSAPDKVAAKPKAPREAPPPFVEDLLRELRVIRAAVAPIDRSAAGGEDGLGSAVNSMRRLLSELLERNDEAVLRELVPIRHAAADSERREPAALLAQIDRLMDRLGAISFSAQKLDFVDPSIHEIKGERHEAGVPDGVVAESLRPGFRSASGVVLAKAWVAVNRRSGHEPARH